MSKQDELLDGLLKLDFAALETQAALRSLGQLVDLATDANSQGALLHAISSGNELLKKSNDSGTSAVLHYFLSNAWAGLRQTALDAPERWNWNQPEAEQQVFQLRLALQSARRTRALNRVYLCRILTNLANVMDEVGRVIEAIRYYEEVLEINPGFGMAHGNLGIALKSYAEHHHDRGHAFTLIQRAYSELWLATQLDLNDRGCQRVIAEIADIEKSVDRKLLAEIDTDDARPPTSNDEESKYRTWCSGHRLFLNSLNDLGIAKHADHDCLILPPITVPLGEGPKYPSFYNQIKQEYVAARFLCHEAVIANGLHFADRGVVLLNTLDYPAYSLATEKLKCSFRMAYSLFDKLAFFLNDYLELKIHEKRVNFRSLWFEAQDRKKPLRSEFAKRENWPLRGLFWLSKDLAEDREGFRDSLEPEFQDLVDLRNHLEHKHLKLHVDEWSPVQKNSKAIENVFRDTLAFSIRRSDFLAKTIRLLVTARAALIYTSLAVHAEEQRKELASGQSGLIGTIPMECWSDDWKR